MKVVILAGGAGTRLAEETALKPKPMVEIGGRPILWHIMKHYAHHGFKEFFIALGHRSQVVKRFFLDYYRLNGSLTVDLSRGVVTSDENDSEDWVIHLKNTGKDTNTGGRLKRLAPWLSEETFMLTYGDGVSNIDLSRLLHFHRAHKKIGTVTAVRPPARFGGIIFSGDFVCEFTEKPQIGEGWINGGFMVFEPAVFDYLEGDDSSLEVNALERLAADQELVAFRHEAFWQCMDTMREVKLLESLWRSESPPWKIWS